MAAALLYWVAAGSSLNAELWKLLSKLNGKLKCVFVGNLCVNVPGAETTEYDRRLPKAF